MPVPLSPRSAMEVSIESKGAASDPRWGTARKRIAKMESRMLSNRGVST
jgi:hypothetical protein